MALLQQGGPAGACTIDPGGGDVWGGSEGLGNAKTLSFTPWLGQTWRVSPKHQGPRGSFPICTGGEIWVSALQTF